MIKNFVSFHAIRIIQNAFCFCLFSSVFISPFVVAQQFFVCCFFIRIKYSYEAINFFILLSLCYFLCIVRMRHTWLRPKEKGFKFRVRRYVSWYCYKYMPKHRSQLTQSPYATVHRLVLASSAKNRFLIKY